MKRYDYNSVEILLFVMIAIPLFTMAGTGLALIGYGIYGIIAGHALVDIFAAFGIGVTCTLFAYAVKELIFA